MRFKRIFNVLLALWLGLTCTPLCAQNDYRVAQFLHYGLDQPALGPELKNEVVDWPSENVEPGKTVKARRIYYDGAVRTFYQGSGYCNELEVTSRNVKLPFSLKIGDSEQKVRNALGTPAFRKNGALIYRISAEQVEFLFFEQRLIHVHWLVIGF